LLCFINTAKTTFVFAALAGFVHKELLLLFSC
jgi:hypothetical protein